MPEGDTIWRAAHTLRGALVGETVRRVLARAPTVAERGPQRLVGQHVAGVGSHGKHLQVSFAPSGLVLHTHMRMTGSWHTYRPGERWRKAPRLASVALETDRVVAVCFTAPVCELLAAEQAAERLAHLGPDALAADGPDLQEAGRRLASLGQATIGDALLDQRVLAGVGNVYKSEVCFIHGLHPWQRVADIPGGVRDDLLHTAATLLERNARAESPSRITTVDVAATRPGDRLYVYGRAGRPCLRCASPIRSRAQGRQARRTFWCPRCQPRRPAE